MENAEDVSRLHESSDTIAEEAVSQEVLDQFKDSTSTNGTPSDDEFAEDRLLHFDLVSVYDMFSYSDFTNSFDFPDPLQIYRCR